ncbi:MAG: hypothetical protein OEL77_03635 [Nitrosopumilus sp.]|nr:hypothetical protein [Nitrosopumilus sp.]MDH3385089.1 hypothetical protein [Nitrosopumilus sp.]
MGKKEALSFLKKNNKSIIQAWQNYKLQIGRSNNSKLDGVFEQMFKAWLLSNKKAITLLEKTPKKSQKSTKTKDLKPKNSKS